MYTRSNNNNNNNNNNNKYIQTWTRSVSSPLIFFSSLPIFHSNSARRQGRGSDEPRERVLQSWQWCSLVQTGTLQ